MKKSIFLFFAAILCAMSVDAKVVYLKLNDEWSASEARYYVHVWGGSSSNTSIEMQAVEGETNMYKIEVGTHNSIIFLRHKTTTTVTESNKWNNLLNRLGNLSIPEDKNCCTINNGVTTVEDGNDNGAASSVTWSTYTPAEPEPEPEPVETHDITVKAKYPAAWNAGKAAIHFWGDGVASPGTPAAMTKDGDWWSYTVTGVPTTSPLGVVFINGDNWSENKNQTVDITGITESTCYQITSGSDKATAAKADCETGEAEVVETHDITVKAFYPAAWNAGKAAIHFWGEGVASPGTPAAMEKDGDWWSYTVTGVPTTSPLSVVFINGDNWSENKNQTVDITGITESTCYQITSGSDKASAAVVDCASTPVVAEDVYTVVGSANLFGSAWAPSAEANDMEKQDDGSYKKVYSNVELTSSVQWKIAKNDDWWNGPSFNSENNTLAIAKSGIYNVTFVLSADLATATAEAELLEETNTVADCYISGNAALTGGAGWAGNEFKMEDYDSASKTYSYTLTGLVTDEAYELKVVLGGVWYGFAELVDPAPANVSEGTDNSIAFKMAAAGDVVVTYNVEDGIGLTGNFAAPVTYDYYLTGTLVGGWSAKQQGIEKDGELYKATFNNLAAGTYQFKITDGQFNTEEDKTHEHTALGAEYEEVGYHEGNIQIVTKEVINLTVIFNAATDKITFEGLTENETETLVYTVEVPEGTEDCYIAGEMNEWAFERMTQVNATQWTITYDNVLKTTEYKYACQASWDYKELDKEGNDIANRTWTELDTVEKWAAPAEPVEMASVVLLGVEGDWTDGIEMELNPYDANEYMLLCQSITADEPIKIKAVDTQSNLTWCAKLADTSLGTVEKDADGNDNIVLEEGKYDFYYKVAENEVWIGTCTETEPEYMVVEEEITNFVFDMEAWPMVCMGGPSTGYQIEVFLVLTEDVDGTLSYEDCSVSIMGQDVTLIEGTLSNIDPYAPSADAVLRVQMGEEYYELHLAMSSTPAEPFTIETEDATVTLTEYSTNFEGTEFAYELKMVAEWVNEAESLPYTVEFVIPTFDPTKASGEYLANFWVTGEGNAFGMNENVSVTVTKDGNNVTLTGNVSALNSNAYNVTISGTLPDYTRTVALNQWGTICLPKASSSFTGATFYEVSSLDPAKGLWLDQLEDGAQLEAGKPYIFQATATEIAVVYTGAAKSDPVAGANGLTGTFTDIAAGGVLVDNYIIANNAVWVANENNDLPANRAYINAASVPTETQAEIPGRRRVCMGENATTGLDQIVAPAGQAVKAIENGQLIIIRDGVKYNVQGQVIR